MERSGTCLLYITPCSGVLNSTFSENEMGRSQRLKLDEIRDVFRLIGELCELGQNQEVWRRHMLERLGAMVGATVGYTFQSRPPFVDNLTTISSFIDFGMTDRGNIAMFSYLFEGGYKNDPTYAPLIQLYLKGQHFTMPRSALVPDEVWLTSDVIAQLNQQIETSDFMTSQYFIIPPFTSQTINLHRARDDRRLFGQHEQRVTHLFHTELGRLWDQRELPTPDPCEGLSPRMRQVVRLLRAGHSEKEIAAKTDLSRHTVHDYVKRLHIHFDVSNRAGLLTATNPPPVPYRPALAP